MMTAVLLYDKIHQEQGKSGRMNQGTRLAELRRSNAAGLHSKRRKDRRNTNRKAIERSTNHE